mgnify:FL=1
MGELKAFVRFRGVTVVLLSLIIPTAVFAERLSTVVYDENFESSQLGPYAASQLSKQAVSKKHHGKISGSAIAKFMSLFPHQGFDEIDIDSYNAQSKIDLEYIRDFIVLHYKVTDRDDSEFWRYCQNMKVSDRLQAKMDLYQTNGRIFRQDNELFNETSWLAVMHGQGLTTSGYHPLVDILPEDEVVHRLEHIHSVIQKSVEVMPMHKDFIKKHCQA